MSRPEGMPPRWRWLLALYVAGLAGDLAWHLAQALQIGDRTITLADLAVAWEAGLFWPVDLVVRAMGRWG